MNSCVLLAAGYSSRFGSPKALAKISDKTVIEHLQYQLLTSWLDEIIIVLGAHEKLIRPLILKHKKIKVVYNKDYNLGQTSSFKAGLKGVSQASSLILLLPVDYPFVQASTIDQLIQRFKEVRCDILLPTFKTKRGHPPVFSSLYRDELLALANDQGVNTFFAKHPNDIDEYELNDASIRQTFNTPEEFGKL